PIRGGFSVRLRYGAGKRDRFVIPTEDRTEAQKRAHIMAALAQRLTKAGKGEMVPLEVSKVAQGSTKGLGALLDSLKDAPRRKAQPGALTFRDLAEEWTSGKLARKYPDYIRTKRSAPQDVRRFAILNKTIGDVP